MENIPVWILCKYLMIVQRWVMMKVFIYNVGVFFRLHRHCVYGSHFLWTHENQRSRGVLRHVSILNPAESLHCLADTWGVNFPHSVALNTFYFSAASSTPPWAKQTPFSQTLQAASPLACTALEFPLHLQLGWSFNMQIGHVMPCQVLSAFSLLQD